MARRPLPRLLITAGDPNGIGPEIAVKCFLEEKVLKRCRPLIVGCPEVMQEAARILNGRIPVREIDPVEGEIMAFPSFETEKGGGPGFIPVVRPEGRPVVGIVPGKVRAEAGRAAYQALRKAHCLIRQGRADAMVTGPINKEALHRAGYARVAHTEILASWNRRLDPLTLFVAGKLWIAFFTRHLPLRDAIRAVRRKPLIDFVKRLIQSLEGLGFARPRLAMAALNPHAGEGGLLGKEEQRELEPAMKSLRKEGVRIQGPIPADAVFHLAREGAFDCVISLYHDQGHIAAKTARFHDTVSLTLGLPYIRTSVDHGTGFDIAWQGKARHDSLCAAALLAARLVMRGV